ncbi:MAG: YggU family protein [Anaerolineales bacterium]|nr:YggU family protein [Anaerolineales bacterium]MCL4257186.1 YggU family protein [Anaerolineales bacterium]QYK50527.1 MAG: YggU family protein [Anaerolineales bacterium]
MARYKLSDGRGGAALAIRVTPRASRNEIVEILPDNTIKVRLTAPPVDGKANEALIEFLSKVLSVARSRIEIVAGETGRDKLVTIIDMESSEAQELILKQLEQN